MSESSPDSRTGRLAPLVYTQHYWLLLLRFSRRCETPAVALVGAAVIGWSVANSVWELHYIGSPFDDQLNLLVVRIEHTPLQGRAGQLDDWIRDLDAALQPLAQPAINGPDAVLQRAPINEDAGVALERSRNAQMP